MAKLETDNQMASTGSKSKNIIYTELINKAMSEINMKEPKKK